MTIDRRAFIAGSFSLAAAAVPIPAEARVSREPGVELKLGLVAFSFDKQLRSELRFPPPQLQSRQSSTFFRPAEATSETIWLISVGEASYGRVVSSLHV